jgi:hypothetical protein
MPGPSGEQPRLESVARRRESPLASAEKSGNNPHGSGDGFPLSAGLRFEELRKGQPATHARSASIRPWIGTRLERTHDQPVWRETAVRRFDAKREAAAQ